MDSTISYADSGSELAVAAAKFEYENSLTRYQRLVNKAYIMLTACAFLFSGILEILKKLKCARTVNLCCCHLLLRYSPIIMFLLAVGLFSRLLVNINLSHFNPQQVLDKDMFYVDKRKVAKYLCLKYVQNTNTNNEAIEKRYKIFNYGMFVYGVDVVLVLLSLLFG